LKSAGDAIANDLDEAMGERSMNAAQRVSQWSSSTNLYFLFFSLKFLARNGGREEGRARVSGELKA